MALRSLTRVTNLETLAAIRWCSQASTSRPGGAAQPPQKPPTPIVTGLSEKVVLKPGSEKVGPGAAHDADYKVPEYFLYGRHSYHEAEIELLKHRCPQPDANRK